MKLFLSFLFLLLPLCAFPQDLSKPPDDKPAPGLTDHSRGSEASESRQAYAQLPGHWEKGLHFRLCYVPRQKWCRWRRASRDHESDASRLP